MAQFTRAFTLMAKPSSSNCNIHCNYCFYVDKVLSSERVMSDQVLEAYVKQYLTANPLSQIDFIFQGGEPTLCGLEFFEKVVKLQQKYGAERNIQNYLQTNGVMLDKSWAEFLKAHNFLVGISIDGPQALHDLNRVTIAQQPTYQRVLKALELLKEYEVDFNTLTVISAANAHYGSAVYQHLVDLGSKFMQFIPLTGGYQKLTAAEFAKFTCDVCDEWFKDESGIDQGISVQMLEQLSFYVLGIEPPLCIFKPHCGEQLVLEQNGDVYACDHFVSEPFKLGNILKTDLLEIVNSQKLCKFSELKSHLPGECLSCQWCGLCKGGCPAHRQGQDPAQYDSYGVNSLCEGYKAIFEHVLPPLRELLRKRSLPVVR